jgi:hypothetical protein
MCFAEVASGDRLAFAAHPREMFGVARGAGSAAFERYRCPTITQAGSESYAFDVIVIMA